MSLLLFYGSAPPAAVNPSNNLLSADNWNFEGATHGWVNWNAQSTNALSTDWASLGTHSLKWVPKVTGTQAQLGSPAIAVTGDETYWATMQVAATNPARTGQLSLQFFNAANAAVSTVTVNFAFGDMTGPGATVSMIAKAPATAVKMHAIIRPLADALPTEAFYLDQVILRASLVGAAAVGTTTTATPSRISTLAGSAAVKVSTGPVFRAAGGSVDSGSTSTVLSPALTVPAGVRADHRCVLVVSWVGTAGEPPGTYTPSGEGWSTALAPGTYANMGYAIYSRTGLVAGDTFTVTGSVARLFVISHVYYAAAGTPVAGPVTSRNGVSSATTTATAVPTTERSEPVLVVSVERTTATGTTVTVSPTATTRSYVEGSGTSTNTIYIGEFIAPNPAVSTAARVLTYNSASGNGAANQLAVPSATALTATQAAAGAVSVITHVSGTITRSEGLAGVAAINTGGSGQVIAQLTAAGDAAVAVTASGDLLRSTFLSGTAHAALTLTATAVERQAVSAAAGLTVTAAGTPTQVGAFDGNASIVVAAFGTIPFGTLALDGTASVVVTAQGTAEHAGKFNGNVGIQTTVTGTLSRFTGLDGSAAITVTVNGRATTRDQATARVTVTVAATGTPSGTGALSGSAAARVELPPAALRRVIPMAGTTGLTVTTHADDLLNVVDLAGVTSGLVVSAAATPRRRQALTGISRTATSTAGWIARTRYSAGRTSVQILLIPARPHDISAVYGTTTAAFDARAAQLVSVIAPPYVRDVYADVSGRDIYATVGRRYP